jgi:hypothetical protein
MHHTIIRWSICGLLWPLCPTVGSGQEVQSLLLRIKAVGKEGAGNIEAAKAWKELVTQGPGVLTDVLGGMDDANPIAVNWLRGAVERRFPQNDSLRAGGGYW